MARIQIYNQSRRTKDETTKLRFRLKDGRNIQLYHRSEIVASISDLEKFEVNGEPKKRSNFNRQLRDAIRDRMTLMLQVYDEAVREDKNKTMTSDDFEMAIDRCLHPESYATTETNKKPTNLLERFSLYIDENPCGEKRKDAYRVTLRILERFLAIFYSRAFEVADVNRDFVVRFYKFMIDEYKYVSKHKLLYRNLKPSNVPQQPRASNTVAVKLKQFKTFLAELVDEDEITKLPFKTNRKTPDPMLQENYDEPYNLTLEELQTLMSIEVPARLLQTKKAFLLQCALGCRISDFKLMTMANVRVHDDGFAYITYRPEKTKRSKPKFYVVTPLVLFALNIVKESNFQFPILNYASGKSGYNAKIRELLEFAGIDRMIDVCKEDSGTPQQIPIYQLGSSKLGRKTYVSLSIEAQVNKLAGGLHSSESSVAHYGKIEPPELFTLLNEAFKQPAYKVDRDLNIIND